MRRNAVDLVADGVALGKAAAMLGMSLYTLRAWCQRARSGTLGPNLLGRPACRCAEETKREIEKMVVAVGINVSVRYIRERMPHVPRAVVERVVREHKKDLRREERNGLLRLEWEEPGRVWVCDWTEPDTPVDGRYKQIFVVRDLGSGLIIKALPSRGKSAAVAASVLGHLFTVCGAPLVLKTDNGSEFMAGVFQRMLEQHKVVHLLSPTYYPPYNGAIEAGIGSLKVHALAEAMKRGTVHMTCNDIEAGRLIANETSRPRGPKGPSPDEMWRQRSAIRGQERKRFNQELEITCDHYGKLYGQSKAQRKAGERRAIEKTLVDGGYLAVKRRRFTPQVYEKNRTDLT